MSDETERRFANGYRVLVGPVRADGCRDVHVHDRHGRASGHTAVATLDALGRLLVDVEMRPSPPGWRETDHRDAA